MLSCNHFFQNGCIQNFLVSIILCVVFYSTNNVKMSNIVGIFTVIRVKFMLSWDEHKKFL